MDVWMDGRTDGWTYSEYRSITTQTYTSTSVSTHMYMYMQSKQKTYYVHCAYAKTVLSWDVSGMCHGPARVQIFWSRYLVHVHINTHTYIIYIYICTYVCMHICTHIHVR